MAQADAGTSSNGKHAHRRSWRASFSQVPSGPQYSTSGPHGSAQTAAPSESRPAQTPDSHCASESQREPRAPGLGASYSQRSSRQTIDVGHAASALHALEQ